MLHVVYSFPEPRAVNKANSWDDMIDFCNPNDTVAVHHAGMPHYAALHEQKTRSAWVRGFLSWYS